MCLIYYRDSAKVSKAVDLTVLEEAFYSNPDGVGVVYVDPKTSNWSSWRSVKSGWKSIAKRLAWLESNSSNWAVHFRYATAGSKTVDNAHPFQVAENIYLMHNGVLGGVHEKDNKSDTRQLAERLAATYKTGGLPSLLKTWAAVKLLADGNRLLLTLPGGKLSFAGNWVVRSEGKYSNSSCFYTYSRRRPSIGFDTRGEWPSGSYAESDDYKGTWHSGSTITATPRYRSTSTTYWNNSAQAWEKYDFTRGEWMLCEYDSATRKHTAIMSVAEYEAGGKPTAAPVETSYASVSLGGRYVDLVASDAERSIRWHKADNKYYLAGQHVAWARKLNRWYYVDSAKSIPPSVDKVEPKPLAESIIKAIESVPESPVLDDFTELEPPSEDDKRAFEAFAGT